MRVLFLDIDGVLNSRRTMLAWGSGHLGLRQWRIRNGVPHVDLTLSDVNLDPVAVSLLRTTVEIADLKIVISSTWRMGTELSEFHIMFDLFGWDTRNIVIGATPRTNKGHRGTEIDMWLAEHPEVDDFMIIDDDSDMTDQQKAEGRFVHTTFEHGLSADHIDQMLAHFNVSMTNFLERRGTP